MSDDATEILNLLYIYAEYIDAGDFGGAADLFARADVTVRDETGHGAAPILKFWQDHIRLQADGTPRSKHITTNPILMFADDRQSATVRSTYVVIQATPTLPLQVITSGRYHDTFAKTDGRWHFSSRLFTPMDLRGDTSQYFLPTGDMVEQFLP